MPLARPSPLPTWATDATFTGGPDIGGPTKAVPSVGRLAQGWRNGDVPPAQEQNYWQNLAFQWIQSFNSQLNGVEMSGGPVSIFAPNLFGATLLSGGPGLTDRSNSVGFVGKAPLVTADADITYHPSDADSFRVTLLTADRIYKIGPPATDGDGKIITFTFATTGHLVGLAQEDGTPICTLGTTAGNHRWVDLIYTNPLWSMHRWYVSP